MHAFVPATLLWLSLHHATLVASYKPAHTLPEDIYAHPKFRVSFMNGSPVLRETAQRWLRDGLRGGVSEFLDEPLDDWQLSPPWKRIEGDQGDQQVLFVPANPPHAIGQDYTLETMKMGPKENFLCLIPKVASEIPQEAKTEQSHRPRTPAQTLASLNDLWGKCLYHRHGWFTYSYCHGKDIRQFKERQRHPLAASVTIEEDPEWKAYTLGTAPTETDDPGVDLAVAERYATAGALEVSSNGATRYLVQRWGNGTMCDKTGKPRDAEVQFHCLPAAPDTILHIKETKTCSYVVVIQTAKLCDEPGFKSRRDTAGEAVIRCREILEEGASSPHPGKHPLPQGDVPVKLAAVRAKPGLSSPLSPPPPPAVKDRKTKDGKDSEGKPVKGSKSSLAKALEDILRDNTEFGNILVEDVIVDVDGRGSNEIVMDIVDYGDDDVAPDLDALLEDDRLVEILRAAGIEVHGEKGSFSRSRQDQGQELEDEKDNTEDEMEAVPREEA